MANPNEQMNQHAQPHAYQTRNSSDVSGNGHARMQATVRSTTKIDHAWNMPRIDPATCARKLKVLSDETRFAVILQLMKGPAHVSQINEHLRMEQSLLSHHLRILREAGLVDARREGRQVRYSLTDKVQLNGHGEIDLGSCVVHIQTQPARSDHARHNVSQVTGETMTDGRSLNDTPGDHHKRRSPSRHGNGYDDNAHHVQVTDHSPNKTPQRTNARD